MKIHEELCLECDADKYGICGFYYAICKTMFFLGEADVKSCKSKRIHFNSTRSDFYPDLMKKQRVCVCLCTHFH